MEFNIDKIEPRADMSDSYRASSALADEAYTSGQTGSVRDREGHPAVSDVPSETPYRDTNAPGRLAVSNVSDLPGITFIDNGNEHHRDSSQDEGKRAANSVETVATALGAVAGGSVHRGIHREQNPWDYMNVAGGGVHRGNEGWPEFRDGAKIYDRPYDRPLLRLPIDRPYKSPIEESPMPREVKNQLSDRWKDYGERTDDYDKEKEISKTDRFTTSEGVARRLDDGTIEFRGKDGFRYSEKKDGTVVIENGSGITYRFKPDNSLEVENGKTKTIKPVVEEVKTRSGSTTYIYQDPKDGDGGIALKRKVSPIEGINAGIEFFGPIRFETWNYPELENVKIQISRAKK